MTKKEQARDLRLRRLYGINSKEYDKVLAYQGGVCFVCKLPPKEGSRLHVDHDHATGLTRGLLHWKCNAGLQKFRDDPVRLENAAAYLRRPPVTAALGREVFGRTGRITNKRKRKRRRTRRRS